MSVTPSLPQWGRHPKGNIPLIPGIHLSFFGFFTNFFEDLPQYENAIWQGQRIQIPRIFKECLK